MGLTSTLTATPSFPMESGLERESFLNFPRSIPPLSASCFAVFSFSACINSNVCRRVSWKTFCHGFIPGFPCSLGSLSRREIPSNSSGSPATLPVPRLPPIASAVMKDRSRLRHVPIPAPARPTASSILWTGSTPSRPTFRIAAAIACATMGRLPIAHNRRKPSANSKPRRHRTLPHRAKRPLSSFNGAGHLGPALSRGFSRWTPSCAAVAPR